MDDSGGKRPTDSLLHAGERPTLKTISRITGLAVATVSRALHDAPDIGEDTKRRVNEVAGQIGYRPNRAGVRLRTGKTNVISLVLSTDHDVMNHTARLISSIVAELRGTPYHMIVTPYFPGEDPMIPIKYIVESGSADGVIMNQIRPDDPRVAYLMQRNIPFATHGRSNWCAHHAYFDFDNARFGQLASRALGRRNRKNIVLVAPPDGQNYSIEMTNGAREGAEQVGANFAILEGATSDSISSDIEDAIEAHLTKHPATDAFICGSTSGAMSAANRAEKLGRVIGQDIDIFAKEAIPFLAKFRSAILTVHEDVGTAGQFLARAVIKRITDPDAAPMQGLDIPELDIECIAPPH